MQFPKVHSFDVFDTCLTRRIAIPSGVFYEVAKKFYFRLGIPCSQSALDDFVSARIQAEQAARNSSPREDVSLDEIWRNLAQSLGHPYHESLTQCELEAEAELLAPINSMRRRIQSARQRGCRIIFTSDMYLPKAFIKTQLEIHGFAQAGDNLYVSADVGKTKASGNLFHHILEHEKVSAASVLHVGDNRHSDLTVPRRLGIRAGLFSETKLTRQEIGVIQTFQGLQSGLRIAGAMRASRLVCESNDSIGINRLTSEFAAPFVMGFATWVLKRAQESGVKRLYFLSRDCQLFWKVARELSPQFGGIDCRYLYVSRQSLYLPSATEISQDGMPWIRKSFESSALKYLLAKLELKFEDVQSVLGDLAGNQGEQYLLNSEHDWQKFWDALNKEPVKERICGLISLRREAARRYFESGGFLEPVKWSLVDFGWTLSCQQSLRNLFRMWGFPDDIRGYYLGLRSHRVRLEKAGYAEALFYEPTFDVPQEANCDRLVKYAALLEHIVGCADHPTVHHYENLDNTNTYPAFEGSVDQATLDFCSKLHNQVLEFVGKNQSLVCYLKNDSVCRDVMSSLGDGFFNNPSKHSASALVGLSIALDQNGMDPKAIVRPLNFRAALLRRMLNRGPLKKLRKPGNCYWREGAIAITPQPTKQIVKMALGLTKLAKRGRRAWIEHLSFTAAK
jgi:FMN phosphatase YigB (HAD superfamily)